MNTISVGEVFFDMIHVEGGLFHRHKDAREVTLPSFFIAKYPVTQELWKAVMGGENPSFFRGDRRPVECVSWFDAVIFCNALNALCGYEPGYFHDPEYRRPYGLVEGTYSLPENQDVGNPVFLRSVMPGYRLPSEAEWEYAARGGKYSGGYVCAGGDDPDEVGWYDENSHEETKPVGLKLPNELGLYDMSGNVWEWCGDSYNQDEDAYRVCRGGGWFDDAKLCSTFHRYHVWATFRDDDIGFRLVLSG